MSASVQTKTLSLALTVSLLMQPENLRSAEISQCHKGETVFFACQVSRGKEVALCGTVQNGSVTSRRYIFGKRNTIELAYPAQSEVAKFTVSNYFRAQVVYNEVHFRSKGAAYTIFKRYDAGLGPTPSFGVEALSADGREQQFICKAGSVIDRLPKFMEGLKCDPDGAFGC